MNYTTTLRLRLPEYTDVIDIEDINENTRALDEYIGTNNSTLSQLSSDIENILTVPASTTTDNGKFLRSVNGVAVWQAIEIAEEVSIK